MFAGSRIQALQQYCIYDLFTLCVPGLPESVLRLGKAEEAPCSQTTPATDLPASGRQRRRGAKRPGPLGVSRTAPLGVACRSFGMTKSRFLL